MRGRLRKSSTGRKVAIASLRSKIDGNILILGERLRLLIHSSDQHLVKDRRHHLRVHSQCFIAKDVVDWLVQYEHAKNRQTAVKLLNVLMRQMVLHPVYDEETDFQDDYSFYRFSVDNDTLPMTREIEPFIKGERVYSKLTVRGCPYKLLKMHMEGGVSYKRSFYGNEFVAWLMKEGFCTSRQQAVMLGKDLLENDVIRHVTLDHHFKDERLLFQFNPNMDSLKLSDLPDLDLPILSEEEEDRISGLSQQTTQQTLSPTRKLSLGFLKKPTTPTRNRKYSDSQVPTSPLKSINSWPQVKDASKCLHRSLSETPNQNLNQDGDSISEEGSDRCSPPSNRRYSPVDDLDNLSSMDLFETEGAPHKETVQIFADSVGYGFVVRGKGPVYVKAVDPGGPAAAAGLKASQVIIAVNGVDIQDKDHKEVALIILGQPQMLRLDVLACKT